jgi:phosphopantothenoylcysteine decarboxylase / phosphopantothenate---cysteine ligase
VSYHPVQGKHIVLGVTGGIAAYKAAELASRLVKAGAQVDVVMTEGAQKFVAPLTFQALTHRPAITEMFSLLAETEIGHVSLAQKADLLVVAPATANTIAKLALGLADNMLTTTALATRAPIVLAPAMESAMWDNLMTQQHVRTLVERGVVVVGPAEGRLASGATGIGRMAEPSEIFETVGWILARRGDLAGRSILITAGGTREPIDPVRFIGNHSSGKMGYALAEAARDRGAAVTLISTLTNLPVPLGVKVHPVQTALDMAGAVMEHIDAVDALIMAAAVADFRPNQAAGQKIKREAQNELTLHVVRNPDILAQAVAWRGARRHPLLIGFAAETQDLLSHAQAKLQRKKVDMIVANDITAAGSGFGSDTNQVTLLIPDGSMEVVPVLPKLDVAHHILDRLIERWAAASARG